LFLVSPLSELSEPEGRSTIAPIPLEVSGWAFSPDCDWWLRTNATGTRLPVYMRKASHYVVGVFLVRPHRGRRGVGVPES